MEPMKPMKPMQPMAPMRPMEPMKPMEPMRFERWWPEELGEPSTSGASNDLRYAFFPEARRLLIERNGRRATYDTGSHRIGGVSSQQANGGEPSLSFSSQHGAVRLDELRRIDEAEHGEPWSDSLESDSLGSDGLGGPHGGSGDERHAHHGAEERLGARSAHPHDERRGEPEPPRQQRPQQQHAQQRHEERASAERVVFSEEAGAGGIRLLLRGNLDVDMIEALEDFLRRQKRRLSRAG